jgi:polysaccharide export outer membrane protein
MRIDNLSSPLALLLALSVSFAEGQAQNVASAESGAASLPSSAIGAKTPALADNGVASQFALGPSDVIRVNVWKNADLSQTLTIDPEGFISLPLVGDVHAAGMTTNQLAQLLASKLTTYLLAAQVTVSVVEIHSRQVFVLGQVAKAGSYSLTGPLSVLQLIAQAGGLTTFANRKNIIVLRTSSAGTQRLNFNYVAAIQGDSRRNITLEPGDTVIVP